MPKTSTVNESFSVNGTQVVIINKSGLYFLESHSDYVDADDVTKRYRK